MISLVPINKIIVIVAIMYAAIVGLLFAMGWKPGDQVNAAESIKAALAGATALNLILLGIIYFAWRWIWKLLPFLNRALFPDLNGEWTMKIEWAWGDKNGTAQAIANIKQDFLRISMEVESSTSESETMMARPAKDPESGRPTLYYVYRVIPKHAAGEPVSSYQGAAILKVPYTGYKTLSGNYFTNQKTLGRFQLTKK